MLVRALSRRFRRLLELLLLSALLGQHALGALHYVDAQSANPVPPYTNWANAALTIQDAVDAAANSDQILVANGWYNKGGGFAAGVSNRVAITKALTTLATLGARRGRVVHPGESARCGGEPSERQETHGPILLSSAEW